MSKIAPTMEELVRRPVVRQLIDSEWMSKMSAREFRAWEDGEIMTMIICKHPKHEHHDRLQQQIEFKEMQYKLRKEQILEHKKKHEDVDKSLNEHTQEILEILDNGITKHRGKDICLGGELNDLVGIPGVSGAVFRADKYEPVKDMNGRQYPKNWATGVYDYVSGKNTKNNYIY